MNPKPIAVVTGGAGFIGSHVVDLLITEGFRVRIIDNLRGGRLSNIAQHSSNPDLTFENRDIRTLAPGDSLFTNVRYVFHFAGIGDIVPSIDSPQEYMSANALGTVHVLEAARAAGIARLVYAASSSCYGLAEELPTTEKAAIRPQYPYALSKYHGEQSVLHWGQVYGLPVNSIRIFNTYGPRSRTTGAYGAVFGVFLAQKLAGQPLTIVGDGAQSRDFVYVTDVARAFYAAADRGVAGRIYNLGTGLPQSINRLASLLGGETVSIPWRPGEPQCTWADITRIRTELGWVPQVTFEQGVRILLEHIENWRDAPVWNTESIADATRTWFGCLEPK